MQFIFYLLVTQAELIGVDVLKREQV